MARRDKTVRAPKAAMGIFAEFKDDPDPEVRQRASNWSFAIGLQDVDHLNVSQFLIDTAKRNIRGEITQEEVARLIEEHYSNGGRKEGHCEKSSTLPTWAVAMNSAQ